MEVLLRFTWLEDDDEAWVEEEGEELEPLLVCVEELWTLEDDAWTLE